MTDKPITDLCRRMLEDMAVRRMGEKTKTDYIKHIEAFTRFLGRAPDTATGEDLRRFQVHELQQGSRPPKMNTQVSALRFFFGKTLGRLDLAHMTLELGEFIRRFMLHVLPKGFHRIRHYGLFASCRTKAAKIERTRGLIRQAAPMTPPAKQETPADEATTAAPDKPEHPCPSSGGRMVIIETFETGSTPHHRPSAPIAPARIDTS